MAQYEVAVTDLQRNDVCRAVQNLLQDGGLPVLPDEGPGGAVAVLLPSGVLVTENVVGHYSECGWGREGVREGGGEGGSEGGKGGVYDGMYTRQGL